MAPDRLAAASSLGVVDIPSRAGRDAPLAGSQHTSFKLAEHLVHDGIAASIGSVGDAYDNALMESTFGLYKTELIKPQRPGKTLAEVELATRRMDRLVQLPPPAR